MKILWHSNAPWSLTGYGKQTRLFAPRIRDLGHDIAISAFFGLNGASMDLDGITVYPAGLDGHGNDVLELHAADFFGGDQSDGIVISLTDVWVLSPKVLKRLRTAAWVPIDHEPAQPPSVETMRKGDVVPIAMSRFGERMLQDENFEPLYAPHGVETDVFTPRDRAEVRRELGLPKDTFVVGMVAANQGWRKSYPQAIRAFRNFHARHPDSLLYLHTWLGPQHSGVDLAELLQQELPRNAVAVADQYRYSAGGYTDPLLARLYASFDVLLNPAQGEGFGVPIIEAQACGTPVIATNCTAMTELVGAGWLVEGTDVYTQFQSWQKLPSIEQLEHALEDAYAQTESERVDARNRARAFALDYDADVVAARDWDPLLRELEERLS